MLAVAEEAFVGWWRHGVGSLDSLGRVHWCPAVLSHSPFPTRSPKAYPNASYNWGLATFFKNKYYWTKMSLSRMWRVLQKSLHPLEIKISICCDFPHSAVLSLFLTIFLDLVTTHNTQHCSLVHVKLCHILFIPRFQFAFSHYTNAVYPILISRFWIHVVSNASNKKSQSKNMLLSDDTAHSAQEVNVVLCAKAAEEIAKTLLASHKELMFSRNRGVSVQPKLALN